MNHKIEILRIKVEKVTQILAGRSIAVTQVGSRAFVMPDKSGKPVRVNIPYLPDDAPDDLIAAVEGFLDHEVGHLLFTDFAVYTKNAPLCRALNAVEDTFVERKMSQKFKGSAENLDNVGRFFCDQLRSDLNKASKMERVAGLFIPVIRALSGQVVFERFIREYEKEAKIIKDAISKETVRALCAINSTSDSVKVAKQLEEELKKAKLTPEADESAGATEEGTSTGGEKGESSSGERELTEHDMVEGHDVEEAESEEEADGELGDSGYDEEYEYEDEEYEEEEKEDKESSDSEGSESESSESEGSETDGSESEESESSEGEAEEGSTSDGEPSGSDDAPETPGESPTEEAPGLDSLMPSEDDFTKKIADALSEESLKTTKSSSYAVVTTDNDVIEVFKPKHVDSRIVRRIEDETTHMLGTIQKSLERAFNAECRSFWMAGRRRGRLNNSALHRLNVGDDRVFRNRVNHQDKKNTVVSFVLDCSGSMGGGYHGSKIELGAITCLGLSAVLSRIKIEHEVIGFTTKHGPTGSYEAIEEFRRTFGRSPNRVEPLYMPIFKQFGERFDRTVKERIAMIPSALNLSQNVDGECVMIAAKRLMARKEARKIMFVLSDGQPAAPGCGGLREHLRKVVKDLPRMGIQVFGIGIMTNAVRDYYPDHVILNNVSELPKIAVTELQAKLLK